jgi:ABC-2 type transport system ATP-binding protein
MAEASSGVVQVRDLSKKYGLVEAARGVSFEVQPGEIFGLLGPNGAGKTTVIECLLGLRQPDRGSFRIGDTDAFAAPRAARRLIGAQLQSSTLQDKITPREAIALISAFYPHPTDPDVLLERFALSEKVNARFDSLSGGQKQRLLLALAFVHRPALLLLDEPTVGLDPAARRDLHRLIALQRDEGRAVLLSTHYLDEAAQLCDRVAILDAGKIVACDAPQKLVERAQALPRIRLRTALPLEVNDSPAIVNIATPERSDGEIVTVVQTRDIGGATTELVQTIERTGNSLFDLQIERPSLEDVFLELTGKTWTQPTSEDVT